MWQHLKTEALKHNQLVVMSFFNDMENLKVLNISNIKGVKQNYVFFFFTNLQTTTDTKRENESGCWRLMSLVHQCPDVSWEELLEGSDTADREKSPEPVMRNKNRHYYDITDIII